MLGIGMAVGEEERSKFGVCRVAEKTGRASIPNHPITRCPDLPMRQTGPAHETNKIIVDRSRPRLRGTIFGQASTGDPL
jgi:hypothetical protein